MRFNDAEAVRAAASCDVWQVFWLRFKLLKHLPGIEPVVSASAITFTALGTPWI